MRNKLSPERKVVHKLILNQIIRDIKKFTNHNVKSIVSSFVLILFLTACEKDDALSLKATDDSKSTNVKEFVDLLRAADPKNRVALIEDFESRNKINLNDSIDAIHPIMFKSSGVETDIEYVGSQSLSLDMLSGYTNQHISVSPPKIPTV
ncbi:MAG TPA: hypothetical protein VIR29_00180 [Anseongella sp.]